MKRPRAPLCRNRHMVVSRGPLPAQRDLTSQGFPVMAKPSVEHIAKANTDALTKSGDPAEKIVKGNADVLIDSGNASSAAVQELTKAYRELAAKNATNLTAAIEALSAVKNP